MPTNGSAAILKASAANGALGSVSRVELLAVARVEAGHRRHVERRGQVVDHRVEHRLDSLVLERRAAQHGHDLVAERAGAQRAADLVGADLLAVEVLGGNVVVDIGQSLDHLVAPLTRLGLELARDVAHLDLVAEVVAVGDGLHVDQIDHAAELVLVAHRHLQRHRVGTQAIVNHLDRAPEVGTGAIQLIDKAEARHAVPIGLAPDGFGLRLDARHAVEDDDCAIEHPQAPLDLHRKIHVAGRVEQVDAVVVPEAGRGGGGDGDPPLLLLLHPVHRGGAFV